MIGVQKCPPYTDVNNAPEAIGAQCGMLIVETIAKIRRVYFQDKKPIKQIWREFRVSRNTVRKVIRSGVMELTHERRVQPQPEIGPWKDKLDEMLAVNARKPKREILTRIRAKEEQETSAAVYVPLTFHPGEAYQFDWSHETVVVDGAPTTVMVAHVRPCHSRMLFVRAYPREVSRWNAIGPREIANGDGL